MKNKKPNKQQATHQKEGTSLNSPTCYASMDGMRGGFDTFDNGTREEANVTAWRTAGEPGDIPEIFAEAWHLKDAAYLASLFDKKADFVNVTGLWWTNRAEIEEAHRYGFDVIFPKAELEIISSKTRFLSDTSAVVHAMMRLKGQSPGMNNAKRTGTRKTLFVFIAQRIDKKWICVAAQNTEIIPGAETFIKDSDFRPVSYR